MGARAGLVGRDAERTTLDDAVRGSVAGSPSAVLVFGESGIGKTRLVTEVTTEFERRGGSRVLGPVPAVRGSGVALSPDRPDRRPLVPARRWG